VADLFPASKKPRLDDEKENPQVNVRAPADEAMKIEEQNVGENEIAIGEKKEGVDEAPRVKTPEEILDKKVCLAPIAST